MKTKLWYGLTVFECNVPANRPGVYSITDMETKMTYIGISFDIASRIRQHTKKASRGSRISSAILDRGPENFLATPLFYATDNSCKLESIEASLIAEFQSVKNGFNVLESSKGAGPYGPLFSKSVSEALNRPDVAAKRAASIANPSISKRRGDAIREAHARPEVKEKLRSRRRGSMTESSLKTASERMSARQSTPEGRARVSAQMKTLYSSPEFKERHLNSTRIANSNPDRNSKISSARIGGCWITDGVSERFIKPCIDIPQGWMKGRIKRLPKY